MSVDESLAVSRADGRGVARTSAARPAQLADLAKRRRYRRRNLHDSYPVPPSRRPKRAERQADPRAGYVGPSDRWDAVVCRFGYVADEGAPGRIGWALLGLKQPGKRLRRLIELGVTVQQHGDTEVAGDAPASMAEAIIRTLGPLHRAKGTARGASDHFARGVQAAQAVPGWG